MTSANSNPSWTAIAIGTGLAPKGVARTLVQGNDIAYWRGEDGAVRAWHNRCPHRGMRLSFGFVRGSRLTCIYHGWTYGGDGGCAAIPAHPKMVPPRTIRVDRYDAVESGGLIWIASVGGAIPAPAFKGAWRGLRSLAVHAPADRLALLLGRCAAEPGSGATPSPNVLIRAGSAIGADMLCAVQAVDGGSCFLHAALDADAGIEAKRGAHAWLKRLRASAEDPSTASSTRSGEIEVMTDVA